jgi:hypothetical protein
MCLVLFLHERAVKIIGRYLLAEWNKGFNLYPTSDFKLNIYVDANWSSM